MAELKRCNWSGSDPVYVEYHDKDWGVPVRDDRRQFEFLVLESAQAGLSWITILKRRDGYRRVYEGFDPEKVVHFDEARIKAMLQDEGIIRNRKKIESSINNAKRFLEIQDQYGSFCNYFWGFTDGRQVVNHHNNMSEIMATTPLSDTIAKDMKSKGFQFLGSTTLYAHMQATGLVNDHLIECFRYKECIEH